MSNIVPPLLSNSPPPMLGVLDEEEDEFGDFAVATDISYGCDALSLPSSPKKSTEDASESISSHCHDGNATSSQITSVDTSKNIEKDFQDRRKTDLPSSCNERTTISDSSVDPETSVDCSVNNSLYNTNKISSKLDNKYSSFQYFPEIPPDFLPENEEDEFVDVTNHLAEELDNFQDSESFTIGDSNTTTVVDEASDFAGFEFSQDLASQTSGNFSVKNNKTEVDCAAYNEAEQIDSQTGTQKMETDSFNSSKMGSSDVSGEAENEETIYSKSKDFVSGDATEFTQLPELSVDDNAESESKDNSSSKDDEDGSYGDAVSSASEDLDVKDEKVSDEEPFTDFADHISEPNTVCQLNTEINSEFQVDDEADDDFADFESVPVETKLDLNVDPFVNTETSFGNFDDQVFGESSLAASLDNFGDFSTFPTSQPKKEAEEDDDFGDFNDYCVQTQLSQDASHDVPQLHRMSSVDIEGIPQKAHAIILEMFPVVEQLAEEYHQEDFTADSSIFEGLKDVTDTCALLYQWSKSNSQSFLLQALNIDTRNILYGPRWNESMPRYAATLGFTPLEPVKSEMLTPTAADGSAVPSPSQTPFSEAPQQSDIPSAQFDWVGSGLTNPLEMTPKKIVERQEIKASALAPLTPSILPKPAELDPKPASFEFAAFSQPERTTASQNHDGESVKSLQLNDEAPLEETASKAQSTEFDNFTSFQSPAKSEGFSNWSFSTTVPLRETHISSHGDSSHRVEEPGWLKPTIVTPDLPRKDTADVVATDFHEEEDEFADFQASEPVGANETIPAHLETVEQQDKTTSVDLATNDDDEFTDFQSILPSNPKVVTQPACAPPEPVQPSPPMFQPLQPCVLQPIVSANAPAAINWPDPGISDDDLRHIELNYQPAITADLEEFAEPKSKGITDANTSLASAAPQASEGPSKTEDEDDWSDFVSSQVPTEPSVVPSTQQLFNKTTTQMKQPSRTATPELQLSVPQLNHIQPPKKPVPIITQEGLVQTKLSANLPISIEPLIQPSVQQTSAYPQNGFQPSLISNQFALMGQGLMYPNNLSIHPSNPRPRIDASKQVKPQSQYFPYSQPAKPSPVPIPSSVPDEHEEEWTDFVSSQPAPSISNGLPRSSLPKPNFDWNRPPQFTSWSANVTPNIITNPVSFDSFQSYSSPTHSDLFKNRTGNRKNPSVVVQPKKNTVPSISSVPDLEFIAPKNRTWKK